MAPLIVITGPTASGKSGLALKLAEHYQGEIICADSRTVYKGLDIGTAKPSKDDQARVPHHLLDVVEPDEHFTVHDFQRLAVAAIVDIRTRGKVPFLVGGSGLYIDSVVLNYNFVKASEEQNRSELEGKSPAELLVMIKKQHLPVPVNEQNKRHLIGTLERANLEHSALKIPDGNTYVVSIATDKETLRQKIVERADLMFASGVIDEARRLSEKYGWDHESMRGNIYPILHRVLSGEITETEAKELFIIRDRQLAKRQVTWLKRHDFVHWLSLEEAEHYLHNILESYQA